MLHLRRKLGHWRQGGDAEVRTVHIGRVKLVYAGLYSASAVDTSDYRKMSTPY